MKTDYEVFPEEPKLIEIPKIELVELSDSEKRRIYEHNDVSLKAFFIYLVSYIIAPIVIWVVIAIANNYIIETLWNKSLFSKEGEEIQFNLLLISACVLLAITIIIALVRVLINIPKAKRDIEREPIRRRDRKIGEIKSRNSSEFIRVQEKANKLTEYANNLHNSSLKLSEEMQKHLEAASDYLKNAEFEFKRNIPRYFWTEIENAADHLAIYSNRATQTARNAEEYFGILNGQKHNFPNFIITVDSTRQARTLGNEFKDIQDKALAIDYFGMVLEHREDRQHMSFEFRKLGKSLAQAITNLGEKFENSISELNKSITSEIARSVEAEIETREKLEESRLEQNQLLSENNRIHIKTQKLIDRSLKE